MAIRPFTLKSEDQVDKTDLGLSSDGSSNAKLDGDRYLIDDISNRRYALEFDGKQLVNVGDIHDGPMSISAWIHPSEVTSAGQRIVVKDGNDGWALSLGDPGDGRLRFFTRSLSITSLDTGQLIEPNKTYFVVGVWDGDGTKQIWVNSAKEAEDIGLFGTIGNQTVDAGIAADPDNLNQNFDGVIDDVRQYDRALSEDEVQNLYEGKHVSDGLVGWWKLDDGSGLTARDSSGNGNHGELVNSPTWIDSIKPGRTISTADTEQTDSGSTFESVLVELQEGAFLSEAWADAGGTAGASESVNTATTYTSSTDEYSAGSDSSPLIIPLSYSGSGAGSSDDSGSLTATHVVDSSGSGSSDDSGSLTATHVADSSGAGSSDDSGSLTATNVVDSSELSLSQELVINTVDSLLNSSSESLGSDAAEFSVATLFEIDERLRITDSVFTATTYSSEATGFADSILSANVIVSPTQSIDDSAIAEVSGTHTVMSSIASSMKSTGIENTNTGISSVFNSSMYTSAEDSVFVELQEGAFLSEAWADADGVAGASESVNTSGNASTTSTSYAGSTVDSSVVVVPLESVEDSGLENSSAPLTVWVNQTSVDTSIGVEETLVNALFDETVSEYAAGAEETFVSALFDETVSEYATSVEENLVSALFDETVSEYAAGVEETLVNALFDETVSEYAAGVEESDIVKHVIQSSTESGTSLQESEVSVTSLYELSENSFGIDETTLSLTIESVPTEQGLTEEQAGSSFTITPLSDDSATTEDTVTVDIGYQPTVEDAIKTAARIFRASGEYDGRVEVTGTFDTTETINAVFNNTFTDENN